MHEGWTGVTLVGRKGDEGADVIGTLNGVDWIVQAKYRSGGRATEADAVDEVKHAMEFYDVSQGAVATNTSLSPAAVARRDELKRSGYDIRLWDGGRLLDRYERAPDQPARPAPRDYQEEATAALLAKLGAGERRGLVVLATGLGKTFIAADFVARAIAENPDRRVLWLAHQRELISQLERASWMHFPKEIATHIWVGGERPRFAQGVTFATFQALNAVSEHGERIGPFDVIVVDEAHHAMAPSFREVLDDLDPGFMVGMTATPWRGDDLDIHDLFGPATFTMDIVEGMRRGFLAQIDYSMMVDNLDWRLVAETSRRGYTVSDLNSRLFLPQRDEEIAEAVRVAWARVGGRKGIVFTRTIDHAIRFSALLTSLGFPSAVLSSEMPMRDREQALRKFRHGRFKFLVAVDILNEGIDVPDVDFVVFLRVTHSRRIFVQQLGRGLRLTSSKSKVSVFDFVSDIRRVAAGFRLNEEDAEFCKAHLGEAEQLRLPPGAVVAFSDLRARGFFEEYLKDVASIESMPDRARLTFP